GGWRLDRIAPGQYLPSFFVQLSSLKRFYRFFTALPLPRRQYPCHARGLAIEVGRGLQPILVGIPGEHELSALEAIDHHARHFRAHRRAALAAADAALGSDPGGIHVVGRMDDNRALAGAVVYPGFEPVHAQRIAVLAAVALGRAKQADARLVAADHVGKARGLVVTGFLPVGDEILEQQSPALKVENPESPF